MKYLIILLLCLFGAVIAQAQTQDPAELLLAEKEQRILQAENERKTMQQARLIFEGRLISTAKTVDPETALSYRSSVIRMTQVLRGELHPGTVQVAYGGHPVSRIVNSKGEVIGYDETAVVSHGVAPSPVLPENVTILFFCRPLPSGHANKPKVVSTANGGILEIVDMVYYTNGENARIDSSIGGAFANKQALYRYLADRYQVATPLADR
jgi:hypothetical protein